jgi:hypothetical protein
MIKQPLQQFISTQTDVTASRALDGTVYQNTSTKPMFVHASVAVNGNGGNVTVKSDANSTPVQTVGFVFQQTLLPVTLILTFIVLPGNYYSATQVQGCSIQYWIEYS